LLIHYKLHERDYDEATSSYTDQPGQKYTVQRFMPVPYNLTLRLDLWTSNTVQKLQLLEQMLILFNPDLNLQTSTNPLDWTAITYIDIGDLTWSSRSVPMGTENTIDISSNTFNIPIWLNPPAKVKKQTVIHQIVTNILEDNACLGTTDVQFSEGDLLGRMIVSPGNHYISIDGNEITLLGENKSELDATGNPLEWATLLEKYGNYIPGTTQLYIKRYEGFTSGTGLSIENRQNYPNLDENEFDIIGTIDIHPTLPNKLIWSVDPLTLQPNTLNPILAIIDPHKTFPGAGLPAATTGQRYMLLNDIGGTNGPLGETGTTQAWGSLTANKDDVIMYDGTEWAVDFNAQAATENQFMINSFTGKQLYYEVDGTWILAVDGEFQPGSWRLFFN